MAGEEPSTGPGVLHDPARLEALSLTGLTAAADPVMEAFAGRVRRWLDVPVALVSLVQTGQQVFPGMVGLPEPWASRRSTPLTHSFCQHVVTTAEPLAVPEAREHPVVRDNLAVPELGVVAYLGMPLTDGTGLVLGSLCAIDTRPRQWTDAEFRLLRDLAHACSGELQLRLARVDAQRERDRRDELDAALNRSFELSQTLLVASQAFTDTATVEDVRVRISALVDSELRPSYVGLSVLDPAGLRLRRLPDPERPPGVEDGDPWAHYGLGSPLLTAAAVREQRIIHHPDRDSFDAAHPAPVRQLLRGLGLHAVLAAPLPGQDGPMGAMVLGWDEPRSLPTDDLVVVTTIAGYAAQALDRARVLDERRSVAHQLQRAMMTTLPDLPGLPMAAAYRPADAREDVGGDWYDTVRLDEPDRADEPALVVSVGDIVGHALAAATVMGQARSMLRQAAWDHPGGSPARILSAFERANTGMGVGATGTAVLATLRRSGADGWSMTWTNAGHPPPIMIDADGSTTLLDEHDALFGFPLALPPRTDHHVVVAPGATLFLYTDGLVERRDQDFDDGTAALCELLGRLHDRPVRDIVDTVIAVLGSDSPDDVVAFAIRFPDTDRPDTERPGTTRPDQEDPP